MAEDDFRAKIGQQDFQASLQEKSTEEIEFDLKTNRIAVPNKRAIAEIELKRRQEESELTQVKNELADCQRQLQSHTPTKWTGWGLFLVAAITLLAKFAGWI